MSIGARLRQHRQERALPIEAIVERTRIQPHILDAIERDDFASIPGGLYARGYLRAYARAVGVDPEEIVRRYVAEQEPAPPTPPAAPRAVAVDAQPAPVGPVFARAALVLAIAAVPLGVYFLTSPRGAAVPAVTTNDAAVDTPDSAGPAVVATSAPARSDVRRVGTAGSEAARRAESAARTVNASPMDVTLLASHRVWVSGDADGTRVVFRLVGAGEEIALSARERVRLRVGDAGALSWRVGDGTPVPLGRRGEVRDVTIARDGDRVVVR